MLVGRLKLLMTMGASRPLCPKLSGPLDQFGRCVDALQWRSLIFVSSYSEECLSQVCEISGCLLSKGPVHLSGVHRVDTSSQLTVDAASPGYCTYRGYTPLES